MLNYANGLKKVLHGEPMTVQEIQERLHKMGIDFSIQECEGILQMANDLATLAPNYSLETIIDTFGLLSLEERENQ